MIYKNKICFFSVDLFALHQFKIDLIENLIDEGKDVFIVTFESSKKYKIYFKKKNIKLYSLNISRHSVFSFKNFLVFYLLLRILMKEKPDILFNYGFKSIVSGTIVGKICKINKIVSLIPGMGNIFGKQSLGYRLLRYVVTLFYKLVLPMNHFVFCLNNESVDFFTGLSSNMKERTVLLHSEGVNLDIYQYRKLNIEKDINIIFVGRLLYEKGVCDFIDVAKKIRSKYKTISFRVVGSKKQSKKHVIQKLNKAINDQVISYIEHSDDIPTLLEKSHLFILPSFYIEGVPRSTLEAMSVGRPIITTNHVGCKETVIDGYNGFLVDVKSPEQIQDKIEYFINNKHKLIEFGNNSRKLVEEKFEMSKINSKIKKYLFD